MTLLPNSLEQQAYRYRLEKVRKRTKAVNPFFQRSFDSFCSSWLVIQDKQGEIVPLQLNAVQHDLIPKLSGRDLVLKARQVGISTVVQAWQFYLQMKGHVRTSTLCHEDDLTSVMRSMADRFFDNLPDDLRPARRYANARLTTYPDLNSEGSISTVGGTAGRKKGRGGSLTHIHGSEVAYWPDAQGVMSAAMQAGNPRLVLESTANGAQGYFYNLVMEALDGNNDWRLHFYPWWHDPTYRLPVEEPLILEDDEQALMQAHGLDQEQIAWRRAKQRELKDLFLQEYPEDPFSCFLTSGRGFFGNVEHVYTAPEGAEPDPERTYIGGLDFAQAGDYLVQVILDLQTLTMVDMLRINNLPWQEMRRRVAVMANKWHATVWGEANSMGSTNIELLQSGETLNDGSEIAPVNLIAFDTTPASKPPLIQGLYHALHTAGLRLLDRPEIKAEFRAFVTKQTSSGHWQYEASGGAHDDIVISTALAWHGCNYSGPGISFI